MQCFLKNSACFATDQLHCVINFSSRCLAFCSQAKAQYHAKTLTALTQCHQSCSKEFRFWCSYRRYLFTNPTIPDRSCKYWTIFRALILAEIFHEAARHILCARNQSLRGRLNSPPCFSFFSICSPEFPRFPCRLALLASVISRVKQEFCSAIQWCQSSTKYDARITGR